MPYHNIATNILQQPDPQNFDKTKMNSFTASIE
jgi:hypothetical protein